MPVLFVSHASGDDTIADDLGGWLKANGFDDVFIDQKSIEAGAKWDIALQTAAGSCRVVILLVTANWLASAECYGEFKAAWYMGKRIIPLFLGLAGQGLSPDEKLRLQSVCREDQGVDITVCLVAEHRLDLNADAEIARRLKAGLRAAGAKSDVGLDPEAFEINKKIRETPFPGLASFGDDDADAALFYGRSRELAQILEELREARSKPDARPFVILGGSGAGKSSLLKAGIVPRLRRESPAWLPLRAFRPGADPLLNFAEAIAKTYADFGVVEAYGDIHARLLKSWEAATHDTMREGKASLGSAGLAVLEAAIENEGTNLRKAANRRGATILISIDQAEEIVRAEGHSADALAHILRLTLTSAQSHWQLALTTRTDSFAELQTSSRFQALEARMFDLRSLPPFRFVDVVEKPARRYGVTVEPGLVERLINDAPNADALPLLAFALERIWDRFSKSGSLTEAHYDRVGGLNGLIEDAAERAMRGLDPERDVPLSIKTPSKEDLDLTASTFVPALAEVNEKGEVLRRAAHWSEFRPEQQVVLEHFNHWRLVVRKRDLVEVAHEALFRVWKRLETWLEPERLRLEALRIMQLDAGVWRRNHEHVSFLNHRRKRLQIAQRLANDPRYSKRLLAQDFEYLSACKKAEHTAKARIRFRSILALFTGLIIATTSYFNENILRERWFRYTKTATLSKAEEHLFAVTSGRVFSDCISEGISPTRYCPEMVIIPAGQFLMGSSDGSSSVVDLDGTAKLGPTLPEERGRVKWEGPVHEVRIKSAFAVSKYLVTAEQWASCVTAGGCKNVGGGEGKKPKSAVNWYDAAEYVAWMSRVTGRDYRLLTEAEFEYAARAYASTRYHWGDDIGSGKANCKGCGSKWDDIETSPVDAFKPNAFGLYDMHGNLWEWTADVWHVNYEGAPADGSAWLGINSSYRVLKGGSWDSPPDMLRAAVRGFGVSDERSIHVGFRVARTLNSSTSKRE